MFSTVMMLDCRGSWLSWFTTVAGIRGETEIRSRRPPATTSAGILRRLHLDVKQLFKYRLAACQDKPHAIARRCGCD
jgi:hypothetical protein